MLLTKPVPFDASRDYFDDIDHEEYFDVLFSAALTRETVLPAMLAVQKEVIDCCGMSLTVIGDISYVPVVFRLQFSLCAMFDDYDTYIEDGDPEAALLEAIRRIHTVVPLDVQFNPNDE